MSWGRASVVWESIWWKVYVWGGEESVYVILELIGLLFDAFIEEEVEEIFWGMIHLFTF